MYDKILVGLMAEIGAAGWSIKVVEWRFSPTRVGYMLQAESFIPNDDFPIEYTRPSATSEHFQYFTWEKALPENHESLFLTLVELRDYIRSLAAGKEKVASFFQVAPSGGELV